MQEFYIRKNSVNPVLRTKIIDDGRYTFDKTVIFNSLQDSNVTFSMRNTSNNTLKVSKAKANIVIADSDSCEDNYIIEYKWKARDVNESGTYEGWFEITFNGNIRQQGIDFPDGNLIIPIREKLLITVL